MLQSLAKSNLAKMECTLELRKMYYVSMLFIGKGNYHIYSPNM